MIYVRANVAIFLRDNYVTCMKMVIPISWKNKRHNFSRTNLLVFHRDLLVRSTLGSIKVDIEVLQSQPNPQRMLHVLPPIKK